MDQPADETADLAAIESGLFNDAPESDVFVAPEPEAPVAEAPAVEAPAAPEVPAVETPVVETPVTEAPAAVVEPPAVEEDEELAPEGSRPPQFRFRPANDAKTIETAKLLKAGLTIDEANEVLSKREPAHTESAPSPVAAKRARLAELDTQVKAWGEEGGIGSPEFAAALLERSDLVADIRFAERDEESQAARQQAQEQESFNSGFSESSDAVLATYPDAKDPNSELSKRIDADVQLILDTPNHPLRGNPEAPMILAVKHARALKLAPQTGPAPSSAATETPAPTTPAKAATTTPEATTPRSPGLLPSSGAARTAPAVAQPTAAMQEADLTNRLASAASDEEGAGILAVSLFGAAAPANPFG